MASRRCRSEAARPSIASAACPPRAEATDRAPAAARTPGVSCSRGHPASASSRGSPSWVRRVHALEVGTDGTVVGAKPLDRDRDRSTAAQLSCHLFERDRQCGREPSFASRPRHSQAHRARRPWLRAPRAARARARTRRPAARPRQHRWPSTRPLVPASTRRRRRRARGPGSRASADGTRHRDRGRERPDPIPGRGPASRGDESRARKRSHDRHHERRHLDRAPVIDRRVGTTRRSRRPAHRDQLTVAVLEQRADTGRVATVDLGDRLDPPHAAAATRHEHDRVDARGHLRHGSRRAAARSRRGARASRAAASASAGPLAWIVDIEPSCPVFRACNMSSASAPRTSPTTTRSGRIRSAARTRSRTVTAADALGIRRAGLRAGPRAAAQAATPPSLRW